MSNKSIFESVHFLNEGILFSSEKGRNKVLNNISDIHKAITANIEMCEKSIPLLKQFTNYTRSICQKFDKNLYDKCGKLVEDLVKLDHNRGTEQELVQMSMSYMKYNCGKFFNRADRKKKEVNEKLLDLEQKCSKDGEYVKRLEKAYKEIQNISEEALKIFEKYKDSIDQERAAVLKRLLEEIAYFNNQTFMTSGDAAYILPKYKKVELKNSGSPLFHTY